MAARSLGGRDQALGIGERGRHRLLQQHVLAGRERLHGHVGMQMIGRDDVDQIHDRHPRAGHRACDGPARRAGRAPLAGPRRRRPRPHRCSESPATRPIALACTRPQPPYPTKPMRICFPADQRAVSMLPFRPRGNEDVAGLSLRSVKKSFGEVEVVHGVDLEIADREFVVFVGPSGCGKSTLLRMIAGLEDITVGRDRHRRPRSSTSSIPRTATSPWCSRTTRSTRT